ncbi:n6-adeninemlase domain containing protein [Plasmopara halstedii]|uniref:N6-adeninemlase domain containing protein n=1 Tax=Plasmopara halstedii TaxID=4781 RepID=A0A0P1AL76_PLAHL|nr:n6-adeninemlase domain containing protein [Plasmopara halstedii]CEG41902.1 n6-adeninemlase domain containing protein [Plasmopara halstedii]|eukprot:XP_024578271.1 n6-adeninemlase domain containing protein [Plasmopara halstedii]
MRRTLIHEADPRTFWQRFPEKEELNQYWYSADTVAALAKEAIEETPEQSGRIAFLSTPSVYFACRNQQRDDLTTRECFLFDFDSKFAPEGRFFVPFDFKKPENVPEKLAGTFDFVIVDPPFVTHEVWELYAKTIKLLLRSKNSKVLLTTIEENATVIYNLLGCRLRTFKPSIPHLVYQYAIYTNYESPSLDIVNPEISI